MNVPWRGFDPQSCWDWLQLELCEKVSPGWVGLQGTMTGSMQEAVSADTNRS